MTYTFCASASSLENSGDCTSINSKRINNLNIRPGTLKLVQERAGNALELTGRGKDFLNRTQMTQQLKERMDN
jgi:hypothetical protein